MRRVFAAAVMAVALAMVVSLAPAGAAGGLRGVEPPPEDWLAAVNHYRSASGLPPVVDHPAWSSGILAHLTYLQNTPPSLLTGAFASVHTENPASPWYTADGDAAARSSNLGGGASDLDAIEGWMQAPFHAIGILRQGLHEVAFGRSATSSAGIDVIRGLGPTPSPRQVVLFPGPGAVSFLDQYGAEVPDPTEPCGPGFTGLPLIAMLASAPPGDTTATLRRPDGSTSARGPDLCVVTAATFSSTNAVYGAAGEAILRDADAVLVIPRQPLAPGPYTVSISGAGQALATWSFTQAPTFDDVSPADFFFTPVRWLAANAVTVGAGDGRYHPGATVTRAQMASFLYRFAGSPPSTPTSQFADVPRDASYAEAVGWLVQAGITRGVAPGRFGPDQPVLREQMAAFLFRFAGSPPPRTTVRYSDVAPNAPYADAVSWLSENGITQGVAPGVFGPAEPVLRGQMAAFLYRDHMVQ